jgi:rSAM/selenodomain-associated transferase 1
MPIARRQLVVLARWPAPGRCKRRLAASLGSSSRAAAVQRQLTDHTLAVAARAAASCQAQLSLAVDGLGPRARRRWQQQLQASICYPSLQLQPQGSGNLGCRMHGQLRRCFSAGADQVVLIGTDLPGLEPGDLEQAFCRLDHAPVVLGPALDGGYWLIGFNRGGFLSGSRRLMSGIAWGSDQVLKQSLDQAGQLALPVALLREQSDLDTAASLRPWLQRRRREGGSDDQGLIDSWA